MITKIKPQGALSAFADALMVPIMLMMQFTLTERLQRTHFWNNKKLTKEEADQLQQSQMVTFSGDPHAVARWWWKFFPIFHTPAFGGWKNYVVLEPVSHHGVWFPGWKAEDVSGFSVIPVYWRVKLLLGPEPVQFFGLDESGQQITLRCVGTGRIGHGGQFSFIPLR